MAGLSRGCRAETLQRKIDLWKARGQFVRYRWEMFHPASWLAIYDGFDAMPETYDPGVDSFAIKDLSRGLTEMRTAVARTVAETPTHAQFLAQFPPGLDRSRAA